MFPQLYTAASGMVAGERTLELVSNNLANADTPGFKADRALFETYLSDAARRDVPGGNPAAPRGVTVASSWRPEEQGSLRETQSPLDLALTGPCWFRVETPQWERLTRDAGGHVLETNETPATSNARIKIPNACLGLGVRYMTPFQMLRTEQARFVLGGQA